ncbi:MAG: hypothetical protein J6A85_06790 [Clostridia bacterium]|nr:hypothetical protein [Clostridia bacterium]
MDNKEPFVYTYSAKEREEVQKIREKYLPKEADTMETLRRLDESATKKATVISLVFGIVGTLVMGTGMSLVMTLSGMAWFIAGIIIGVIGIVLVAVAYPAYSAVLKSERKRIAPEIIRLTDELLKK